MNENLYLLMTHETSTQKLACSTVPDTQCIHIDRDYKQIQFLQFYLVLCCMVSDIQYSSQQ